MGSAEILIPPCFHSSSRPSIQPSVHLRIEANPFIFSTNVLFSLLVTGERLSSRSNLLRSLEVRGCDLVLGDSLSLIQLSLSSHVTRRDHSSPPPPSPSRLPYLSPGLGSMWECRGASSSKLSTFFLCESCSKVISNQDVCQHVSSTLHQFKYMVSCFSRLCFTCACLLYVPLT